MPKRLDLALTLLFILAVPVLLVTSNVLWAFNEPRLYSYGFERYDIPSRMFMSMEDLNRVADELRDYFNNDQEFPDIRYVGQPFYNEREVVHLKDVKGLVRGVNGLRWGAAVLLIALVIVGFVRKREAFVPQLAKLALLGGGLTLGLLLLAGLSFAVAFDRLFLLFHQLSFSNDLWQLDPARDNLIRMFPQEFWFDAAMFIVLATVIEALLFAAIGGAAWWFLRRQQRIAEAAA